MKINSFKVSIAMGISPFFLILMTCLAVYMQNEVFVIGLLILAIIFFGVLHFTEKWKYMLICTDPELMVRRDILFRWLLVCSFFGFLLCFGCMAPNGVSMLDRISSLTLIGYFLAFMHLAREIAFQDEEFENMTDDEDARKDKE